MDTQEEKLDQISDEELFESAKEPAPVEAPVEAAPEETAEAKADRERDEKGRFVSKAVEETPAVETQTEATPTEPETTYRPVPLTELLNEREKRQAAERERTSLQQQVAQFQRQLQEAQAPKPEPVDIFADPQAYQQSVQEMMSQKLREMEGNFSLRLAASKHGETFQEAWADMMTRSQQGDDGLRQQVLNSPDPGETLVNLYKREKTLAQVGDDPNAFVQQKLEEALNDPAFLAKALEKARGTAGAQPTQNKINIPPSLNKATAAANASDPDDASDGGMYRYATR